MKDKTIGPDSLAARRRTEAVVPGTARAGDEKPKITSEALFGGAREVLIEHEGELYRLRHTSKGKLILTK